MHTLRGRSGGDVNMRMTLCETFMTRTDRTAEVPARTIPKSTCPGDTMTSSTTISRALHLPHHRAISRRGWPSVLFL